VDTGSREERRVAVDKAAALEHFQFSGFILRDGALCLPPQAGS